MTGSAGGWSGRSAPTPASTRARRTSCSASWPGPSPATASPGARPRRRGFTARARWRPGAWLLAGGLRLDGWKNQNGRRLERDRATGAATLDEVDPERSGEVRQRAAGGAARDRRRLGGAGGGLFRLPARHAERTAPPLPRRQRPDRGQRRSGPRDPAGDRGRAGLGGRRRRPSRRPCSGTDRGRRRQRHRRPGPATFPRAGFVPAGGVLRQRQNAGTVEATGVEISARRTLRAGLDLTGAVSITDARLDGGAVGAAADRPAPGPGPDLERLGRDRLARRRPPDPGRPRPLREQAVRGRSEQPGAGRRRDGRTFGPTGGSIRRRRCGWPPTICSTPRSRCRRPGPGSPASGRRARSAPECG